MQRGARPDRAMWLAVEGAGSPELPLRLLNLLAQHDAVVEHAVLELAEGVYRMRVDTAPIAAGRSALIIDKIRAMVLVGTAELVA
jgi:hypothetical protein